MVLDVSDDGLAVVGRIPVTGQPNKMLLNPAQTRLFVALDNSDAVATIDTTSHGVLEQIDTTAPEQVFGNRKGFKGSNPNSLSLSPDETTLFVTNGGSNSVAVIRLDNEKHRHSNVIGLLPTGWYPNSVSLSRDGQWLYVVNGKSNAGPNPKACRDTLSIAPGSLNPCWAQNQYVWQLHRAGLLSLPLPNATALARLTWQTAENNGFANERGRRQVRRVMAPAPKDRSRDLHRQGKPHLRPGAG